MQFSPKPIDARTLAFLQEQQRFRKWAGEVGRQAAEGAREIAKRHLVLGRTASAREWEMVARVLEGRGKRR